MSKYQIIVVIVGLALVGWLYSLPKVVVKNKKQLTEKNQPQPSSSVHNNVDSIKAVTIPDEVLLKIKNFKSRFNNASDKTIKILMADSLASAYKKGKSYDSAALYKQIVADLSPERKNLEAAADMFSEAASFSSNLDGVSKNSELARKYYEKILTSDPEDLNIKSKLAMTYISTENPMTGIKMLRDVVEKDPNNELALFNLGILSLQSNQTGKAADRFEKLVNLNPNHWKGRFYLGLAYKELGKKKKAREQFELVKKLDKDPEVIETVNSYLEELNK